MMYGTVVKRIDSFDKKDCKLSIKFDDKRYRHPFTYKFSQYASAIELLPSSFEPAQPTTPPENASSVPASGPTDAAGRQLRKRRNVDYTNLSSPSTPVTLQD